MMTNTHNSHSVGDVLPVGVLFCWTSVTAVVRSTNKVWPTSRRFSALVIRVTDLITVFDEL